MSWRNSEGLKDGGQQAAVQQAEKLGKARRALSDNQATVKAAEQSGFGEDEEPIADPTAKGA